MNGKTAGHSYATPLYFVIVIAPPDGATVDTSAFNPAPFQYKDPNDDFWLQLLQWPGIDWMVGDRRYSVDELEFNRIPWPASTASLSVTTVPVKEGLNLVGPLRWSVVAEGSAVSVGIDPSAWPTVDTASGPQPQVSLTEIPDLTWKVGGQTYGAGDFADDGSKLLVPFPSDGVVEALPASADAIVSGATMWRLSRD